MILACLWCLLAVSAQPPSTSAPDALTPAAAAAPGEKVTLGCEIAGVRLDRIYWTYPEEYGWTQAMRLSYAGRISRLYKLQDLKGLVRITNKATALRYVRFRTSPMTWNLVSGEMEIVPSDEAPSLPTFGLPHNFVSMDPLLMYDQFKGAPPAGLGGVIPRTAYKQGRFAPPTVKAVMGGFLVTRWTVCEDGPESTTVQKIHEFVSPEGEYVRTVLLQEPAPSLPGVKFRLPDYHGE